MRRSDPCTHPEYVVFLEEEELLAEIDRLQSDLEYAGKKFSELLADYDRLRLHLDRYEQAEKRERERAEIFGQ